MNTLNVFSKKEILRLRMLEADFDEYNFDSPYDTLKEMLNVIGVPNNAHNVVFSDIKTFENHIIGDVDLNARGLHLFRRIMSYKVHKMRNCDETFLNHGMLTFRRFVLPEMHLHALKEMEKFDIGMAKNADNIISNTKKLDFPAIHYIIKTRMKNIILGIIRRELDDTTWRLYEQNTYVQVIENIPGDNDNQKNMHLDTFFPAIKWWWFPEEVQTGGFVYYTRNCNPYVDMCNYQYQSSIEASTNNYPDWKLKDHREGSFRINKDEMMNFGLFSYATRQTIPANTLIVANVSGFHARGEPRLNVTRRAIHGSIRVRNPFEVFHE